MKLSRADKIKAKELSEKYGLDLDIIEKIIASQYECIQKKTRELNFKDGLSREEFDKKKTNFNIPGIGKLYASFYLYKEIQKKKKKN